jgi:hypothetical protein
MTPKIRVIDAFPVRLPGMRWTLVLAILAATGCDKLDAALPSLAASGVNLGHVESVEDEGTDFIAEEKSRRQRGSSDDLRKNIRTRLSELRQRFTVSPLVQQTLPPCHSDQFDDGEKEMPYIYVDARTSTKSLLPRRVSERLEFGGVAELMTEAEELDNKSDAEILRFSQKLKAIESHQRIGVFFVTEYQGPALIIRVGALKRSWVAGHLSARFAVINTTTRTVLCGYPLTVGNDTRDAPIRSRLQAETRVRLERELGRALRDSAVTQLRRDVPKLPIPDTLLVPTAPSIVDP